MSTQGTPWQGDQPGHSVDTSMGTQIERYQLVAISPSTTADNFSVGLCSTAATDAANAIGVAFRAWPYVPQIYAPSGRPSTNISGDPAKFRHLTVRQEGFTWFKVSCDLSGGSGVDILIEQGEKLVPSTQIAGSVMPVSPLTAAYNSALLQQNVIARAYSRIIIPPSGASFPQPGPGGLGLGTGVATLTALTDAITYGYVLGKLEQGW